MEMREEQFFHPPGAVNNRISNKKVTAQPGRTGTRITRNTFLRNS
jgi:hypothetical protein